LETYIALAVAKSVRYSKKYYN